MAISPTWLNGEQIQRRIDVLRDVEQLLGALGNSDVRASVEQRFLHAAAVVARQAVREAARELSNAQTKAGDDGASPVEATTLDLVTTFNTIGPARLARLAAGMYKAPLFQLRGVENVQPDPAVNDKITAKPE